MSSRGDFARVLRYSGATTLAALPIVKGGTSTDVGGIRAWFPGYKTGLASDHEPAPSVRARSPPGPTPRTAAGSHPPSPSPPALPDHPVTSAIGRSSCLTIGWLTAGAGGDCAATDVTGQWAAYVTSPRPPPR